MSPRPVSDGPILSIRDFAHSPEDAAFIAASRTAVPRLVTEVRRLRDERDGLRAALRDLCVVARDDVVSPSRRQLLLAVEEAEAALSSEVGVQPPGEPELGEAVLRGDLLHIRAMAAEAALRAVSDADPADHRQFWTDAGSGVPHCAVDNLPWPCPMQRARNALSPQVVPTADERRPTS